MTLDEILGTIAVPLEHDGLTLRLTPFTNAQIVAWNRLALTESPEGESPLDRADRQREGQLDLLAQHIRACVTDGTKSRVTPKWVAENLPQPVLQDLAVFFVEGKRPAWAGEQGN